jgi:predicted Zn-dependent protease
MTTVMLRHLTTLATVVWLGSGCATSRGASMPLECSAPDRQLSDAIASLEGPAGCFAADDPGGPRCAEIKRAIDRLALLCPSHAPTLLAAALLSYDAGQSARAQQLLDQIFERPRSHPAAAVLRVRIAIEEGNLPFARRLVEEQIRFAPDHPGLREMHGAVLYLSGQFDDARRTLAVAAALGAPAWRVAYHVGLLEEAAGHRDAAVKAYTEATQKNPSWTPAASRLKALTMGQR